MSFKSLSNEKLEALIDEYMSIVSLLMEEQSKRKASGVALIRESSLDLELERISPDAKKRQGHQE